MLRHARTVKSIQHADEAGDFEADFSATLLHLLWHPSALFALCLNEYHIGTAAFNHQLGQASLEAVDCHLPICKARSQEHLVHEEPSLLRSRRKMIRHNAMVQMLMERTVLADIESTRSDRVSDQNRKGHLDPAECEAFHVMHEN